MDNQILYNPWILNDPICMYMLLEIEHCHGMPSISKLYNFNQLEKAFHSGFVNLDDRSFSLKGCWKKCSRGHTESEYYAPCV